ncbi:nodal homolog 2-A-like [Aquarana catesbeiana]|uniref:nodal homolog 2-A-like n=1 Tax=Aquarana catesbeiana TaxID=8400 RepID=UPI003CC95D82
MELNASFTPQENIHSKGLKIPLYMMQLYKTLIMDNHTDSHMLEHPILLESDSVLSLTAKHCSEMDSIWEISFDMTSMDAHNELKLAELRILPSPLRSFNNITLNIYHTTGGRKKIFIGSLQSASTITPYSTWKAYNLTNIIRNYLHHPGTASKASEKVNNTSDGSMSSKCNGIANEKVILVVFSKDKQSLSPYGSPSIIKDVESSKYVKAENDTIRKSDNRRHRRSWDAEKSIIRNSVPFKAEENGNYCRKVDMFVDFEVIGWAEQILHPKRFNAYRCEGSCPVPLNEFFKPSNHAYIKSLVNFYNPDKMGCMLCAPVKMKPLSMLIYEKKNLVLKHHEDMVVEECGCT